MKKALAFLSACMALSITAMAQQSWNLRNIVEYAMANKLSVKQADVQAKHAAINYDQSKLSRYPTVGFSGNFGLTSGTSQDPTTFNRSTEAYTSSGYQLQSSADIFNFYSKQYQIKADAIELQAANANTEKMRNDLALTAANNYLQILLAIEQRKIALLQLAQSSAQLQDVRKRVNAGALPELNATQLEAQVAQDSANVVNANGNITLAILNLKKIMSMPADAPFEVDTPDINSIPLEAIGNLMPEFVYASALQNLPQQKFNTLKLEAADLAARAAKARRLPSVSAFGSLGTNTSSVYRSLTGFNTVTGPDLSIGRVTVGGVDYQVYSPNVSTVPVYSTPGYFSQIGDNFRQTIGLSLNVPIFQQGQLSANYQRARLNEQSLRLQQENDNLNLKQDIYQAYNAALVALDKMNASAKLVAANERAYEFASKRASVGMLGTFELITQQNNLLNARLQYALNQYDYVFKIKVLEFYKGTGIKL